MTAHYNSYFIAKERIKEIENIIYDAYQWNYNKVLPIYTPFDSAQSAGLKIQIEDCIQKSSISIQRHPGSRWEDDSYILVGKARFYAMEYPDAIETFKYVNTKSKNDDARHQALSELIRVFTDYKEFNNGQAVIDHLEKEDLSAASKRIYHLNAAYFYQQRKDENKMVSHLVQAEELLIRVADKARINFIIGQTYHALGFESEAFRYYRNVLKNNPKYELEFYTKLYMAQVTELAKDNDQKRIQKYFRGLLKDPKNNEYKDKIYFELAGFELKNENINEAITNYKLSIESSLNNQRQKGLSYLKLGEIYYDSLKNFALAKNYYDSTVTTLPKDEENFEEVKNRQEILVDFVKQIEVIQNNDSLLHLSYLPEDSVLQIAIASLEKEKEIKEKREKEKAIKRRQNTNSNNDNLIQTSTENSVWYFSNNAALSKGRNEFSRRWGDRILEDDWRRKDKATTIANQRNEVVNDTGPVLDNKSDEISIEEQAKRLIASIPSSEEQKAKLLDEIEEAYYQLGNIYNLRLEEDENASKSFETLLSRFPDSEYEPEVLYQLFLIYKTSNPEASKTKGETLQAKYPESIYAKLVENPNYKEESFLASEKLKKLYKKLYSEYQQGNHMEVIYSVDSALSRASENEFNDNIKLLQILAIGKMEGDSKYQFEMGNFIRNYPESELVPYATSLLEASQDFQKNRYNSAKARFIEDFNQKHFFILVYRVKGSLAPKISDLVDTFLSDQNFTSLKTGNLILDQSQSMILVNDFPGKATAISFSKLFLDNKDVTDQFKGEKVDAFVITEDNFDIFYKTKDVSAYLNFFEKHYQ